MVADIDQPAIARRGLITTSTYKASEGKAWTGPGASAFLYQQQLEVIATSPQKIAMQAQNLYSSHAIVNEVERQVSQRGAAVGYHLEDENGETIDDNSRPELIAIRDLLEKPQALLDEIPQSQKMTKRPLWQVTLRHSGLCGTSFWFLDQAEALAGTPLGILYVNPARIWDVSDKAGNLLGWSLDASIEKGGTPIPLDQLLPFYLDPPDFGHFGIGLVQSIWSKAQINTLADKHQNQTLAAGGRLAGIIAPKAQSNSPAITDDEWIQFVRDYRGIVEDPNAARRLQIVKGAVEYTRTASTMQELEVIDMSTTSRDDIQAHWGVPPSQTGRSGPAGLNSGTTKGYDEATLWQGAIHPRLRMLYETIQYGLLDRFKKMGLTVELVIEEPEFDDSGPAFEMAQRAIFLPLTNAERRDLVGLPPFGDPSMDLAVIMPNTTLLWATAPDENGNPVVDINAPGNVMNDLQAQVKQLTATNQAAVIEPKQIPATVPAAKAVIRTPFLNLRATIDRTHTPLVRSAVAEVLASQKADVIAKVKRHFDHIRAKGKDTGVWWATAKWDAALRDAIRPHAEQIAAKVSAGVAKKMPKPAAKASVAFADRVTQRVVTRGAARITGINQTTRDGIASILADPANDTLDGMLAAIEAYSGFDDYRSELIARTETMDAYNAAALGSYDEFGVTEVEASDGDEDDECASRDGQTFSIDDADGIEDHPNGTLDWIPVVPDEGKALLANPTPELLLAMKALLEFQTAKANLEANAEPTQVHVHVPEQTPPDIYVNPVINLPEYPAMPVTVNLPEMAPVITAPTSVPDVHVHIPEPGPKKITRDRNGNITGIEPS